MVLPESHFAAALMHLYVGTFSMADIADIVSTEPSVLIFLRTQIDFMTLVDKLKISFARYFRENLILNEYPPAVYASIAAEYALFEELVRNQIRIPLFRHMNRLAGSLSNKDRNDLPMDPYDLHLYRRLFSFFSFESCYLPGLVQHSMPELKRIAEEIVWARLGENDYSLSSLMADSLTKLNIKGELRALYKTLKIC